MRSRRDATYASLLLPLPLSRTPAAPRLQLPHDFSIRHETRSEKLGGVPGAGLAGKGIIVACLSTCQRTLLCACCFNFTGSRVDSRAQVRMLQRSHTGHCPRTSAAAISAMKY